MSEKIYLANHTDDDIYVVCGLTPGWRLADSFEKGVATAIMGVVAEFTIPLAAVLLVHNVESTVKSLEDYYKATQLASSIIQDEKLGSRAQSKAQELITQFQSNSMNISSMAFKDVRDTGGLSYLDVSTIGGLLGSYTVYLIVLADGGKKVASITTNQDDSWIATDSGLVRSKFGTINQEDPSAGSIPWDTPMTSSFIPEGSYLESVRSLRVILNCSALNMQQQGIPASYDLTLKANIGLKNVNGTLALEGQAQQSGFKPGGSYLNSCSDVKVTLTCQAQQMNGDWIDASYDLTSAPENIQLTNNNGQLMSS